jgi:hypothetical protein
MYQVPGKNKENIEKFYNMKQSTSNIEGFQDESLNNLAVIADQIFGQNKLKIDGEGQFKDRVILNPGLNNTWKMEAVEATEAGENNTQRPQKNLTITQGDPASASLRLDSNKNWNTLRTRHGYIDFGPNNPEFAHIYTDRSRFILNKPLNLYGNPLENVGKIVASGDNNVLEINGTTESDILFKGPGNNTWEVGSNNSGPNGSNQFYIYDNDYRLRVRRGGGTNVNGGNDGLSVTNNTNEGPRLRLVNTAKTAVGQTQDWSLWNMTGGYGNKLAFWRYNGDGTNAGPAMEILDNGNVNVFGDLNLTKNANIGGISKLKKLNLDTDTWENTHEGDQKSYIVNDNTNYKTLMLVGNNLGGKQRQVSVWDDLNVARDLNVGRNVKAANIPRVIEGYIRNITTIGTGLANDIKINTVSDSMQVSNPSSWHINLRLIGGSKGDFNETPTNWNIQLTPVNGRDEVTIATVVFIAGSTNDVIIRTSLSTWNAQARGNVSGVGFYYRISYLG